MARRFPTFVVLLPVLAACSSTAPDAVNVDPSLGSPVYLDGVTTRFAVCAKDLPEAQRPRYESMRNSVVAGDASMTAAASLFLHDGVYTLDLILCNHGDSPLALDRAQIKLYDGKGVALEVLPTWDAGMDYGLRAERTTVTAYEMLGADARVSGGRDGGIARKGDVEVAPTDMTSGAMAYDRELRVVEHDVDLPQVVTVSPDRHVPYWAYWKAREVEGPLRVTLRVGDRRMVMQFEGATEHWAR